MYAWIDLLCFVGSLACSIYGICSGTAGESWTFLWVGLVCFVFYPFLTESLYYLCAGTRDPIRPMLPLRYTAIVYDPKYNITACGLQKLHPFDSTKYGRVFQGLLNSGLDLSQCLQPEICPRSLIYQVHSYWYMLSLCYSLQITRMVEVPVCVIPAPLLRFRVLQPMLQATYGTVLGALAAVEKNWAINLSGGYHHCSSGSGGGFCVFADITLAVRCLRKWTPLRRVMIVDLDAHQGNGHERDFIDDADTFIVDFFNPRIYPGDEYARRGINCEVHVHSRTSDQEYLAKLEEALQNSIQEFQPEFILYNAGTDCMEGDPLGNLSLSPQCIVDRDEVVFKHAFGNHIPVLMVLSGGYQRSNAPVIARSITNLDAKFRLTS